MNPNDITTITDKALHEIIARVEGNDWVNTGNATSNHDSMFEKVKEYLANPRKMLEVIQNTSWDRMSLVCGYFKYPSVEWVGEGLMRLALDNATKDELRYFARNGLFQKVRDAANERLTATQK